MPVGCKGVLKMFKHFELSPKPYNHSAYRDTGYSYVNQNNIFQLILDQWQVHTIFFLAKRVYNYYCHL